MMTRWRLAVIGGGLAALALFALLYALVPATYLAILTGWGEVPYRFPFLDTHAVLAALQCARMGFDVYVANPCDVLNRPHVYSPLFLEAAILPVTTGWTMTVGIGLVLGFIAALASLPAPRGWREAAIMVLAMLSTMTLYAVERGNNDILIFILVTIAGHLALRRIGPRLIAYLAIVLAACLKFYPLILLVLTMRERPRRFIAINAVALAVVALFAAHYYGALAETWKVLPTRSSSGTELLGFGAVNLPRGMTQLLTPLLSSNPATAGIVRFLPDLLLVLLTLNSLWRAILVVRRAESRARFAALPLRRALFLVIGASLIVGCFFAGQNIGYRGIFFIFLLPGLCAPAGTERASRWSGIAIAILLLMWGDFLVHWVGVLARLAAAPAIEATAQVSLWLALELIWWRVIAALFARILCFIATSEMGAALFGRSTAPRRVAR